MKKKILLICACIAIVAISIFLVILFTKIIPEKKKRQEWDKMIAEYRENKKQQYLAENEEFNDYEVEVAFLGDSLTDGCDLAKYYPDYVTSTFDKIRLFRYNNKIRRNEYVWKKK